MAYATAPTKRKKRKKKKKRSRGQKLLILLLALLCGASAWNYRRNLEAEAKLPRPYRSYSEAQLEQLISASRASLEGLVARYERVSGNSIQARDQGFVGDQIKEFERVQNMSRSVRALGYEISESEGLLRELEAEKRRRGDSAVGVFLRRVFTYSV
jgi:hypothetical protein